MIHTKHNNWEMIESMTTITRTTMMIMMIINSENVQRGLFGCSLFSILFCSMLFCSVTKFYFILLSCSIPFHSVLSCSHSLHSNPFYFTLSCSATLHPMLSCLVLSYPILSCAVKFNSILLCSAQHVNHDIIQQRQ